MLYLEALEVIQLFRKPGGDEFTGFCNKLIRVSCAAGGVPQSTVTTCSRTDAKDGGVDTRVEVPIPSDKSGYFTVPTIWQFKAADESNVGPADMHVEVNKKHARQRIEENHGYRLCVCDHLTDEKKHSLLAALQQAVAAIKKDAPPPMILSVDDLVETANRFPALVLQYRPHVDAVCVLFDPWSQSATAITPEFVPPSGFDATKAAVLAHVDFAKQVHSPVLTLYGTPGAGKTRTLFECLRDAPAAASLVLYTSSEDDVLELANVLRNQPRGQAIVIADDCSIVTGEKLVRALMGVRERIRCVCVDNNAERVSTPSPELVIPKMAALDLENVLRANFKQIPYDRIRAYAAYCDGSVRLAADMCAHYDAEIAQAGTISSVLARIVTYYRVRLTNDGQREAVEAIALLKRVKYKGEAPTELDLLCDLTNIRDKSKLEQTLAQLKDSPGWIEKGALYYRVTPAIIAMTAFESGWTRWAKNDEGTFLAKIPPAIQESFLERVSESASPEVRDTVQHFFRRFADDFAPRNLGDVQMVDRFISLIETDSGSYLPALRRVVEAASADELKRGPEWTGSSWGPRRQLVWAMENFVIFPEHFTDCEAILFRLAQAECEPTIGNNATKMWQHLFRLQMSGTAIPLQNRLELLRSRLQQASQVSAELLSGTLGEILDTFGTRILGPPVVGGRVPPNDWHPKNWGEMKDAIRAGLQFLDEATQHPIPHIAKEALDSLLGSLETLTRRGWLTDLRPFVAQSHLSESAKASLATRLKHVLTWGKDTENKTLSDKYADELRDWIAELEPQSFHARLVGAVGGSAMEHYGREKEWEKELDQLSAELTANSSVFSSEVAWLSSNEAKTAFELGSRLGTLDKSAGLIDKIMEAAHSGQPAFLRGYVAGLLYGGNADPEIVKSRLDLLEKKDPLTSFQIALAGGSRVNAFDRAIRLIEEGRLPIQSLQNFTFWVGDLRVTNDQVIQALNLLLPLAPKDSLASDIIVDFLGARLHVGEFAALLETSKELVWNALSAAARNPGRDAFWLAKALEAAAPSNQPLAIQLATEGLLSESYHFKDEAEKLLTSWVSHYPQEVMASIGTVMLDENIGWRFFASKFGIFHAIPEDVVILWLQSAGVKGAQKLARHLPKPFIDAAGEPQVPKLTAFVLSQFEDDRLTFTEFCAGTHSFQLYRGDMASQREQEAKSVRPFFSHPLKRIREWARYEYETGIQDAKREREREDEINP